MNDQQLGLTRRHFLKGAPASAASLAALPLIAAEAPSAAFPGIVLPSAGKRILLSCKLGMIAKEAEGRKLTIVERLRMAADAGFDGVDFDEAGNFTPQQAREAVRESGVFVHNAIICQLTIMRTSQGLAPSQFLRPLSQIIPTPKAIECRR